jgi:uncharacterized protein with von Willebrand factor type A (vWA) domain
MAPEHPFLEAARAGGTGAFALNIMHFGRVLRAAGLRIGPGRILSAIEAAAAAGVRRRADLYWALHAVLVSRTEEHELFDQAFRLFWQNPEQLSSMLEQIVGDAGPRGAKQESSEEVRRRVLDALLPERPLVKTERQALTEQDSTETFAATDVVRSMDFEAMSERELSEARAIISTMRLPVAPLRTRRLKASPRGSSIDMRNTLRKSLRMGHSDIPLSFARLRERPPPIVALCDISGSMARYSRIVLHFLHALTNDRDRVYSFVFGTRLTNITRQLKNRDVDYALDKVSESVPDWSGGTRIGSCLKAFNKDWSRRVLGQGAVVLLITDGLDQNAGEGLEAEVERLHLSCRRLIWLNPLLRYKAFEPKSLGIRAILPHVDEFRPVHNLAALKDLADALSKPAAAGWSPKRSFGLPAALQPA